MNKRNQYIVISVILLVISLLGIGLPFIFKNGQALTLLVVSLSSLVFVATLLTLLLTRGGQKTLEQAYQGMEKKCLTGALIITSAIVLANGCMSITKLGHHRTFGDDRQMMYRGKGNFGHFGGGDQSMPGNPKQSLPDQGTQNGPQTDSDKQTAPSTDQNQSGNTQTKPNTNTPSTDNNSQSQDTKTQSNN
ncbi:MAG: hypothetical protein J6P61_10275 [Erysipelotrichaceae bacterium]|nr:hypothetical protein [Erysipelotrichaceae bacterium]